MLGERHLGGVRHFSINSSAFVLDGTGSATNNRSVLPSSTPFTQPPSTRKPYKRKQETKSSYSSSVASYSLKLRTETKLEQKTTSHLYVCPVHSFLTRMCSTIHFGDIPALSWPIRRVVRMPRFLCLNKPFKYSYMCNVKYTKPTVQII